MYQSCSQRAFFFQIVYCLVLTLFLVRALQSRADTIHSPRISPQISNVHKLACRTWEDHLLAQASVICEEKECMELSRLGSIFCGGSVEAVDKVVSNEADDAEEDAWKKEAWTI